MEDLELAAKLDSPKDAESKSPPIGVKAQPDKSNDSASEKED